ncbi:hypothetical protein LR48_Vigan11g029200 [Vigna angularis]|uniref:Transmembrane protein n=1 Tax=Phaseolus angularis TaxID=3914 RepID=A0A0L9VQB8_PHAAN|nr:hypothetical protein LR48_Vigan11g029200 [Vigna angularis]
MEKLDEQWNERMEEIEKPKKEKRRAVIISKSIPKGRSILNYTVLQLSFLLTPFGLVPPPSHRSVSIMNRSVCLTNRSVWILPHPTVRSVLVTVRSVLVTVRSVLVTVRSGFLTVRFGFSCILPFGLVLFLTLLGSNYGVQKNSYPRVSVDKIHYGYLVPVGKYPRVTGSGYFNSRLLTGRVRVSHYPYPWVPVTR